MSGPKPQSSQSTKFLDRKYNPFTVKGVTNGLQTISKGTTELRKIILSNPTFKFTDVPFLKWDNDDPPTGIEKIAKVTLRGLLTVIAVPFRAVALVGLYTTSAAAQLVVGSVGAVTAGVIGGGGKILRGLGKLAKGVYLSNNKLSNQYKLKFTNPWPPKNLITGTVYLSTIKDGNVKYKVLNTSGTVTEGSIPLKTLNITGQELTSLNPSNLNKKLNLKVLKNIDATNPSLLPVDDGAALRKQAINDIGYGFLRVIGGSTIAAGVTAVAATGIGAPALAFAASVAPAIVPIITPIVTAGHTFLVGGTATVAGISVSGLNGAAMAAAVIAETLHINAIADKLKNFRVNRQRANPPPPQNPPLGATNTATTLPVKTQARTRNAASATPLPASTEPTLTVLDHNAPTSAVTATAPQPHTPAAVTRSSQPQPATRATTVSPAPVQALSERFAQAGNTLAATQQAATNTAWTEHISTKYQGYKFNSASSTTSENNTIIGTITATTDTNNEVLASIKDNGNTIAFTPQSQTTQQIQLAMAFLEKHQNQTDPPTIQAGAFKPAVLTAIIEKLRNAEPQVFVKLQSENQAIVYSSDMYISKTLAAALPPTPAAVTPPPAPSTPHLR